MNRDKLSNHLPLLIGYRTNQIAAWEWKTQDFPSLVTLSAHLSESQGCCLRTGEGNLLEHFMPTVFSEACLEFHDIRSNHIFTVLVAKGAFMALKEKTLNME